MCGVTGNPGSYKKLLSKQYCGGCISKARSQRRKQLEGNPTRVKMRAAARKHKEDDKELQARIRESKKNTLKAIKRKIAETGIQKLPLENMPIRLKRNESTYMLGGNMKNRVFHIALALTTQRLFFVSTTNPLVDLIDAQRKLAITPGIRTMSLSSVIAIDSPSHSRTYSEWATKVHLDKGKVVSVIFDTILSANIFYVLVAEMVDRLNDPIDESAFTPRRERISDDVKIAVWRRDGGQCVRCGGRENLEYDHIIPVSKGGSNTVRNLELLCESCNRSKSAKIM